MSVWSWHATLECGCEFNGKGRENTPSGTFKCPTHGEQDVKRSGGHNW